MGERADLHALLAALNVALATENPLAAESNSYGRYVCHECRSQVSEPVGGCVDPNCWVELAEMLRRKILPSAGRT